MSDADLYDEFGNYIGPDSDSSSEEEAPEEDDVSVSDHSREDPNAMDYESTTQNFVDGENQEIGERKEIRDGWRNDIETK